MTARLAGSARHVTIDADGHHLAALQAGSPAGHPALLIPGYTGSKEDFGAILGALAGAGFWVTSIDLPGQYESPALPTPADYAPDALARIVTAAARTLGPRVHLLGHSFGGFVSRAAVLADAAPFASHVLMDSGPAAVGGYRRVLIDQLEPVLASAGTAQVYAAMTAAAERRGAAPVPPALADFLRRRFLASSPVMLQGMGEAIRREPDRTDAIRVSAATVPTLVLYGADEDAWSAAELAQMAKSIGCPSVEIAGAAHSPAVENPAATAQALVEFWTR
jgi:pimeloyl-ACP methyl ester carboxylesterase